MDCRRCRRDSSCPCRGRAAPDVSTSLIGAQQNRLGDLQPAALAVLRLTTSSNLVGCSTGRSAGSAPLRIRSTSLAAR
jgi:hypothetical protein